jgi:predicted DNA binding CopG/RHH family protein
MSIGQVLISMKIDADEKELLDSVERGEWKPAAGGKHERTRHSRYAKATFRKDRRLNIRLSSKDLEAIQSGPSLRVCLIRR